jgi:hypothetical protein
MKMQRSIPFIVSGLLILVSCSKKDTTTPITYKSPTTAHAAITVPAGLQTQANGGNFNATLAVSYMSIASGFGQYAADFTLPSSGQTATSVANGEVYSWSYSGYSYWMTYKVLSDKYTWTYEWQTPQIPRFTYIYAEELKTGKSGDWKINSPDGTNAVLWDYTWTLTGLVYNATMNFYDNSTTASKFVVTDNGNNSGEFQYFEGTVKKADIIWNADGTGTYWFSDDGVTSTATGSWTASGK